MQSDPTPRPPDADKAHEADEQTPKDSAAAADAASDDPVTEASMESFPASDPPAWIEEED